MNIFQNIRLGFVHVGVAITFVPINGVLNRIMINEFEFLASLVAALIIFPYLLSPLQLLIGSYSDHANVFGLKRTPFILLGLLLCVSGSIFAPHTAYLMTENFWLGTALSFLTFGIWGLGYNIAAVSYLSLASDMSTPQNRSRVISIMWFMMITSIIFTAIMVGRALEPFTVESLFGVFYNVGFASVSLVLLGLIGLEKRQTGQQIALEERASHSQIFDAVFKNPKIRLFFIYLIILLASILGQDVLLEPFAAKAFGMSIKETTELTAIWGGSTLTSLLIHGFVLNRWFTNKSGAVLGAMIAAIGLFIIALSGLLHLQAIFIPGIVLLGLGTGIATSTNLALMLGMTTAGQTGVFIGAWGVADALSRALGNFLGGFGRDTVTYIFNNPILGYSSVFITEALLLTISIFMLKHIDDGSYKETKASMSDVIAVTGDA